MEPKFDWYTASIPTKPQVVIDCLTSEFEFSEAIPTTPKQGYERAIKIARGDTSLATVMWGGNTGFNVYASASGGDSPAFAQVIRQEFPEHGLIRADVALDFDEEGAWESLSGLALATADEYRLKVEHRRRTGNKVPMTVLINRILDDFVAVLEPRWVQLVARYSPRGGISTNVTVEHRVAKP